jgi:predicted nuclease of predicted toxin-antitoxin system
MKFLLDQDVYVATTRMLRDSNHDVVRVAEIGLARADDEIILARARELGRILVTRDRDFGTLVFVRHLLGGVIYLRILPSTLDSVHAELDRVLARYTDDDLSQAFVVIEAGGHRIRWLRS